MATCGRCGQESPEGFRFCGGCGAALEGAPAREARKLVTVLFCDVAGSTELGERLDPESVRRIMSRYFDEAGAAVAAHGGTVEKFIGDAIMAVFGVPVVHEDDAVRALRAACDARSRIAALNGELERDYGVTLAHRIGVNTGEVVTGDPAAGQRLATGDAVNVAARLQAAAAPGEILVGAATHELAGRAALVEELAPLDVRGKEQPVAVFRLLDVHAGAPAGRRRPAVPLVDRERELALLHGVFERALQERSCHLCTLVGEAGVGKSRLVAELVGTVSDAATLREGRCPPYGADVTYAPLIEALGGEELAAALAAPSLEQTFWLVRELLAGVARERPLVLVLDDLQWAEPSLLDLLEHVAARLRDVPVLLLCVARPDLLERRPSWGGGMVSATSLLLSPLDDDATAELAGRLLAPAVVAGDVGRRVAEAAEGNPLYVEEIVDMLVEEGALVPRDGTWEATRDLPALPIPRTLQALLAARLDQLPPDERRVLECAAVEGNVFHLAAVEALVGEPERARVPGVVIELARKELVRPEASSLRAGEAFRFRHVLARDAAYQAVTKDERAGLHEALAGWLESIPAGAPARRDRAVAHHLEQAYRLRTELGRPGEETRALGRRAAALLLAAGDAAYGRGDMAGAARLLERGTALLDRGDPSRLRALPRLADALLDLGSLAAAGEVAAGAVEEAAAAGERQLELRARLVRWLVRVQTESIALSAQAKAEAEAALPELEALGDDEALVLAWRVIQLHPLVVCRFEEQGRAAEQGLACARRAGDEQAECILTMWLVGAISFGPTPVEESIAREEALLPQVGQRPSLEALVLMHLALQQARLGRCAEARELAEEGWRRAERSGLLLHLGGTGMFFGWIEELCGDLEHAEARMRESYAVLEGMGETAYRSTLATALAENLYRQGRDDEAQAFVDAGREAAAPDDVISQVTWRAVSAKLRARAGALEEAERLAREAVALAGASDAVERQAFAWLDLGEVLRAAGRREEALEALVAAEERFARKGVLVGVEMARRAAAALG